MPAVTDLNWNQLDPGQEKNLFIQYKDPQNPNAPTVWALNLEALTGQPVTDLSTPGVIKAFSKLLDLARAAQETANTGRSTGEKLTAFPAPTFGTLANGYAPVTRTLTARALLSSATQIVGTNA